MDRPTSRNGSLATLTVAIAAVWLLAIIALAGRARSLAARPRVQEVFQRLTGTTFVVIATRLVGTSR